MSTRPRLGRGGRKRRRPEPHRARDLLLSSSATVLFWLAIVGSIRWQLANGPRAYVRIELILMAVLFSIATVVLIVRWWREWPW